MIDRQEIMDFAREFNLRPNVIEKDYALGWLLAGIANHKSIGSDWVFKGGTCLKKCYFETYRFSEDLDFTLTNKDHLEKDFLIATFTEIAEWVYDQCGLQIPRDRLRFDVYENNRSGLSAEGRVSYRGPMQPGGDPPNIKLDLTVDEVLVLDPAERAIHHPYSDNPGSLFQVTSYCFEELFAEKIRALAERLRPRDLYDVVHLFRHDDVSVDQEQILSTLKEKCAFKNIGVPAIETLREMPERAELESEWKHMLAHQLPVLPPFEQFWNELPQVFDWLNGAARKPMPAAMPITAEVDTAWQPPSMAIAWNAGVPLEIIRFAAANRLCVDLKYQGKNRLIEPYSLRRTKDGNLLLHAVKHQTNESRTYRVDRIEGATATRTSFVAKYTVELTPSGPLSAPPTNRKITLSGLPRQGISKLRKTPSYIKKTLYGPTYIVQCPVCGKKFTRKKYNTHLNKHKGKNGLPCYGSYGTVIETKY